MLYANTDEGSSALWVLDGGGVVDDIISIYGAERAPILAQINEHYGTSFTGWSDNEIGLRFGLPIPNWNAYEKIEMPKPFLWKRLGPANVYFVFGIVDNDIITIYSQSIERALLAYDSGEIFNATRVSEDFVTNSIKAKLQQIGISANTVAYDTSTYAIGNSIDNWDEYTLLE